MKIKVKYKMLFLKKNKKFYFFVIACFSFIVLLFLSGCIRLYLPSISGQVFYKSTNEPVKNAYVICFNKKYQLWEALNLGGASSTAVSIDTTMTDELGRFSIGPYFSLTLNDFDLRDFYIYKPGYGTLRYFQEDSQHFRDPYLNCINMVGCRVKKKDKFYLDDPNPYQIDRVSSILGNLERFAREFQSGLFSKAKYSKYKNIFQLYYDVISNDDVYLQMNSSNKKIRTDRMKEIRRQNIKDLGDRIK